MQVSIYIQTHQYFVLIRYSLHHRKLWNNVVVYQESPRGLSDDLRSEGIDLSPEDCERFIANYFKRFPKVEKWVKDIKRFAKRNKYVQTVFGRVRHLEGIASTENSIASECERQSVNMPIQSTGSDCTVQAIIQMNKWLKENNKRSKLIITVHDSIVLDCPKDEVYEVGCKIKHIMENLGEYHDFYKFLGDMPLLAELEIGYDYGHSFECGIPLSSPLCALSYNQPHTLHL